MKHLPLPPLRWLIPIMLLLFGSVLLTASAAYEVSIAFQRVTAETRQRIQVAGNMIAAELDASFRSGDVGQAGRHLGLANNDRTLLIGALFDRTRRVVVATHGGLAGESLQATPLAGERDLIERAMTTRSIRIAPAADGKRMTGVFPVTLQQVPGVSRPTHDGAVVLSYDLAHAKATALAAVISRTGVEALFLATLCAGLGLFLHQVLVRRVQTLVDATARVATGDFTGPVTLGGRDELASLAASLNRMADQLQSNTIALIANREQLQTQNAELQHQQSRLTAILDAMAEGVLLVDGQLHIRELNPSAARLLDQPRRKLIGRHCRDVLPATKSWNADPADQVEEVIHLGLADGNSLSLHLTRVPVEAVGWVLTLRDVTHEEAVSRLKSEFISLVSHELRTPLAIASGYAQLLARADEIALPGERRGQVLDSLVTQLGRLSRMVGDLLNLSRIQEGRWPVNLQPTDVAGLVGQVAAELAPMAASKGIRITSLPPDTVLPAVSADPGQLTLILTNLVDNAIKFADPASAVEIGATVTPDQVRVAVSNQGAGIRAAELQSVFERFYRTPSAQSLRERGTGLGLYISQLLTDLQNGLLIVCSEPGVKTTFSLYLRQWPAAAAADQAALPDPYLL